MTSQSTFDRQPSHNAFVGREREMAELRAGLDDASAGHGRLFLLSGEPGIGKTRLAEEISNDANARRMRVVWGRCWEGGGAPAYWPFIQILRECVENLDSEHLKALLGSGASEIARLVPEITLSLPSIEETKAATDSESARFRLFDAVATLFKNVARSEPLLIVIDDLHDADHPSLQMLRFIARAAKDVSLLMIGTYRDAEVRQSPELGKLVGDLIREGRTVSIAGLSQAEVGAFIERSAAKKADDKLVADLYHATDGNPLFVDGVVRLLAAEGKLARGFDGAAFKIPDGVRESIRRRLAALSNEANSLLSVASVIGNEFETRLLERVSGHSPEQMVERIDEAVRIGILKTEAPGFARQQFSHALIREALYDDLAANRRIELHRDIGAAIEEIYQSDPKPRLAALAHHFRAARVVEKAIDYSIQAGTASYAVFAYEEAGPHWRAALELMDEQGGDDRKRRARILWLLGDELVSSGRRAVEYLEAAAPLYEELGDKERATDVHSRLGNYLSVGSNPSAMDLRRAIDHFKEAEVQLAAQPESRRHARFYIGMSAACAWALRIGDGLAAAKRAMEMGT
jgi:predicted ATPase